MINAESMNARLQHLQQRIERLKTLRSLSREIFYADLDARDAVEHNFQVAVECCLDIAKHIIVTRRLQRPDQLREVFQTLGQAGLIADDFAKVMAEFAGMRNLLIHHYMTVDPEKMYGHLQNDIPHLERFAGFASAYIEHETSSAEGREKES